ncbi:MBL fold metallo-hydrolase [Actinomadura rayongensis]|uniref:MBL fold metallo-hydrolase n=1 Tax=Actinomadura rayongensis TaxID=1429076 RepID=A0A6I4VXL4_9ACTN|nr:MBL fold metallo-hydrolase [Actinomadura rayongensis]
MNITHFGHACVLVELDGGGRLLLDPGTYSGGFEDVTGLDAVLFTHEHPDHLDLGRLPALLKANPGARVLADPGTSARLDEAAVDHETVTDGDTVSVADATVQVVGGDHAVIHPDLPCPHNNGYLIDGALYHPGDAFAPPPAPARVLLLPTGAPWMKVAEGIDYLRAVAPEIAVPIHQGGLAEVHRQLHYQLFRNLGPDTTDVRVLDEGTATAL